MGADPGTDIALLKIPVTGLPVVPWGDSSQLKVAEWVMAVGTPYSLSQTVTLGIVSALGRANVGIAAYEDFIQTDAAINPGNSGGPLFNTKGEVVGINTMILAQGQNLGFAVPINMVKQVLPQIETCREVTEAILDHMPVDSSKRTEATKAAFMSQPLFQWWGAQAASFSASFPFEKAQKPQRK